jgi:predicted signal transduction protein with EAL and GGDEF domain
MHIARLRQALLDIPQALLDVPRLSFRAKALLLAGIAAATPLGALAALGVVLLASAKGAAGLAVTGATAAVSLACLLALGALLTVLADAAALARSNAALAGAEDVDGAIADEVAAMMKNMRTVARRLESVRHRLANRHPVTGVVTREPLLAAIARDLAQESQRTALLGVVRMAQFDRLAAVDRLGAEQALKAFAGRLTEAVGATRPFAQVDRDCFAIWFADGASPRDAAEALRSLADHLAEPIGENELKITPDVRAGAALFPNDGVDGPTLLVRATAALGKAARMSSGRLAFFSEESSADAQARFSMEQALRHAIARQELAVHYQPVVDLTDGRVVGAEALLRWRHPDLGQIPPAQFLPVLEHSGLIDEVGPWVLDTACRDAREFENQGLGGLRIGVNLSDRQFRDPRLPTLVAEALRRHGLKSQRLELELTESALMEDLERTREIFEALSGIGVGLAIDDFGIGASSLADLKSLTFTKLKIDRTFVTDVASRHDSQAICAAMIELGRRLDITVLAEGVETRDDVEALRVLGCSLFQGFFFARPLPADKFARKMADPEWLALLAAPAQRPLAFVEEQRLAG